MRGRERQRDRERVSEWHYRVRACVWYVHAHMVRCECGSNPIQTWKLPNDLEAAPTTPAAPIHLEVALTT
jgi:hypothetical protein